MMSLHLSQSIISISSVVQAAEAATWAEPNVHVFSHVYASTRGRDGNKAGRLLEDRVEVHKIPIGKIHTAQVKSIKRDISQTYRLRRKAPALHKDIPPQTFISFGLWLHGEIRSYANRVK